METKQENVIATDYADVMQKSYIDYAMSVIISRALPDVRDGLKLIDLLCFDSVLFKQAASMV